jgi:rifampicin phosphotransferase
VIGTLYLIDFPAAANAGPDVAGGKGYNLGRLAFFGFTVPAGGVIVVRAYRDFLVRNGLLGETEAAAVWTAEEAASEEAARRLEVLRQRMETAALPDGLAEELDRFLARAGVNRKAGLAVRSSATAEDSAGASFAGIHRSYLNVQGPEQVHRAIKGCYASLWTPQAVTYRRKMGLSDRQVGCALVVQGLVQALYSGIAFTADPVTGRRDRVVINASYGLGESVVGGSVEADEYHLHIDHTGPVKLVGGRIGYKSTVVRPSPDGGTAVEDLGFAERSEPVLYKDHLEQITRIACRVQDTLGEGVQPQDVEWCYDGFRFVVLQSRPITALPEATFPALSGQPAIWSNANLKDAYPGVLSPLGWWFNSLTVEVLLRQIFWRAGYEFPEGLNWSRLFDGRLYMNLSALQWAAYDAFGWKPVETNRALGGHQPEIKVPAPKLTPARFRRLTKMGFVLRKAARTAERTFRQIFDWCAESERQPVSERFHEFDLLKRLWAVEKKRREFLPETMIHNVGGLWSTRLVEFLERHRPGRGAVLTSALLAGTEGIVSAAPGYRLLGIARTALSEPAARTFFESEPFAAAHWRDRLARTRTGEELDAFLREFGHRGVYEMEIMNPRWAEAPDYLLDLLRGYIRDGLPETDPAEAARAKRLAAEQEAFAGVPLLYRPLLSFLVGKAREAMRLREGAKNALVRLVMPARRLALAIGARLRKRGLVDSAEDVFFLTGEELASLLQNQWDGAGLKETAAWRRERRAVLEQRQPPDVIVLEKALVAGARDDARTATGRPEAARTGPEPLPDGSLKGVGVSSGKVVGQVRRIRHPHEGGALRRGEVLVAPSTDPAWTPLFLRAGGVVMEVGGYLSHGAIVAREYGIPAVVNVAGAMEHFQDGQTVLVDGDTGLVTPQGG